MLLSSRLLIILTNINIAVHHWIDQYRFKNQLSGAPVTESVRDKAESPVIARLSTLDRFLPVWIIAAMALGLVLGRTVDGLTDALDAVKIGSVSVPIAIGLLVMMYPVLAKVRYSETDRVTSDRPLMIASLVLNWVFGPALMFA
ncbi:MAG: hypothetical protein JJE02_05285, partial [Propionibacteriales bacterium]|nr:hypothetical protein [Propionibacteriales bacterium]